LATAVGIALAIGLQAAKLIRKSAKSPRQSPYGLQLVDDGGRALGASHGPIRIVFDPFTVYRLAPDQTTPRVTTDEWGARGRSGGDGEVIAFLGGSACFGQELARDDETLTAVLQQIHPNRRWMNFGCPGFGSGQELSFYLHRLRRLAPAVVVSLSGWNDVFGAVQGAPRRPGMEGFSDTFFEVRDRLCEFHTGGRNASVPPPETTRDDVFERAATTYLENMLDLDRLAKARGSSFLWVMQPELGAKDRRSSSENETLSAWERHYRYSAAELSHRFADLRRRAKAAASEHGVAFLDINDVDEWRSHSEALFADPVHPNAAGHHVLAEVIGPVVMRLAQRGVSPAAN